MTKHTQGPWVPACTCNSATHRHPAIISDQGQVAIATFQGSEPATNANARLIAAAPELMEALKAMLEVWEHGGVDDYPIAQARAAIYKATGKTV